MRRVVSVLSAFLTAVSCVHEMPYEDEMQVIPEDRRKISLDVEIGDMEEAGPAKSILDEDAIEDRLTDLTLASYDEEGILVDVQYYTDLSDITLYVSKSGDNSLYALANMGDMTASMPASADDLQKVTYRLGSYSEMEKKGFPMCASMVVGSSLQKPKIELVRMFAKVRMRILHTSLESANSFQKYAFNLCNQSSYVRQANSRLFPFAAGGSRALSSEDIMAESDYMPDMNDRNAIGDLYHPSEVGPGPGFFQDTTIVFYVPENMQGTLLPMNTDPMKKTADNIKEINGMDYSGLCSYIELNVKKEAAGTGQSGSLTYRFYLGRDNVGDFNVERNGFYDVTLDLTDEGFGMDNWKVSKGNDWSDTRSLQFLEDSYVIYPGKTKNVFVHYHRAVGPEFGSELRPDDWIYIFDEEGMKAAGLSFGFNAGLLTPDKNDNKHFCFSFSALPDARIGAGFRLTVMSKDGALKDDAMIYVSELGDISLGWSFYPEYVAQYGEITVQGVSDDLYPISVDITDRSVLECTKSDDDTFRIVALKPGSSTIVFRNRDGSQTYSTTLDIKAPILDITTEDIALNPDGSPVKLDYRYLDRRGVEITNLDGGAFRSRLLPVVSGAGYFTTSVNDKMVTMMINRLYDSGVQINLGSNYALTLNAVNCPGCGSRSFRAYVVDPFDDISVVEYGSIDDYTLFACAGTDPALSTYFKPLMDRNSSFKVGVPRPDARPDCVSVELQPRWKNGYSNENGVYSAHYDPDDLDYASGASLTVSQNSDYSTMKHSAGRHDVMLYVRNIHSQEKIGVSSGYFDIYVHTALGAKAVFGNRACNHKPSGSDSFTPCFAEIYNGIAGKTLFSPSSAGKIYYIDVSAEFMTDISNVYLFERLAAGAGTYNEMYDALKVLQPNVTDGQTDPNTRMLYSVGNTGYRVTAAGEDASNRKGVGVMLYRALRLQTYDSVVSQNNLNSWFLGVYENAAGSVFKPRFDIHDMMRSSDMESNIVRRDMPFYFAPSNYPSYMDDQGRGYHVIHFLEDIKPETGGWINLL